MQAPIKVGHEIRLRKIEIFTQLNMKPGKTLIEMDI